MDVKTDFPMLVYVVDVCTSEGYRPHAEDEDGNRLGCYEAEWLRIRTKVIDYYKNRAEI